MMITIRLCLPPRSTGLTFTTFPAALFADTAKKYSLDVVLRVRSPQHVQSNLGSVLYGSLEVV